MACGLAEFEVIAPQSVFGAVRVAPFMANALAVGIFLFFPRARWAHSGTRMKRRALTLTAVWATSTMRTLDSAWLTLTSNLNAPKICSGQSIRSDASAKQVSRGDGALMAAVARVLTAVTCASGPKSSSAASPSAKVGSK